MSLRTTTVDGNLLVLRTCGDVGEAQRVQALDTEVWPEGYKQYLDLFVINGDSIKVAVGANCQIASYVGIERIRMEDLGTSMPGWDHDPKRWVRPKGRVWYIIGHAVTREYRKSGLSREMIRFLLDEAKESDIDLVAVILRLNHPTLGKASTFWEHHGFRRLEDTFDPSWKASPTAEDSGGVIYAVEIQK